MTGNVYPEGDPVASRIMRAASTIRTLQAKLAEERESHQAQVMGLKTRMETICYLQRQLAEERERHLGELNMESTRLQAQVVDLQARLAEAEKRKVPDGLLTAPRQRRRLRRDSRGGCSTTA